ncbi:MAG: glycosyl hydrolase family 28-related protein, partial [Clostridium sp.]|uniref:glycosyl hydrolase family 28-related protein n=1 Tax=Clostridium sp. TaxID=1506 RepID=UPI003F35A15B
MSNSRKIIRPLEDLCVSLELISVYDLNSYTVLELIYKLAEKINTICNTHNSDMETIRVTIKEITDKLNDLDEEISKEVVKELEKMLTDGRLANIINQEIFGSLSNKVEKIKNKTLLGRVNIYDYEHLKQGNDWSNAINAAFTELDSGGELFIPGGEYEVSKTIVFKSGCKLVGNNKSVLKLTTKGISLINFTNSGGASNNTSYIEGIKLVGLGKTSNQVAIDCDAWIAGFSKLIIDDFGIGIRLKGVKVTVEKCVINRCSKAIDLQRFILPSTMIEIRDCMLQYNTIGMYATDEGDPNNKRPAIHVEIKNTAFEHNDYAYNLQGIMALEIEKCWFEQNKNKPIVKNFSVGFKENRYE